MKYYANDLILPLLREKLPDPCPIKVVVDDDHVFLFVGPRDWQWDRATGELVGAGTSVTVCGIGGISGGKAD